MARVKRKVLTEDQAFGLLAFLMMSARLCVDEPENYGTFRLIDAASRLLGALLDNGEVSDREFYGELKEEIDNKKLLLVTDEEAYARFLSDAARKVARQMKTRAARGAQERKD